MKKLLASLIAATFALTLTVGCGDTPKATVKDKDTATVKEKGAAVKEKESATTGKEKESK